MRFVKEKKGLKRQEKWNDNYELQGIREGAFLLNVPINCFLFIILFQYTTVDTISNWELLFLVSLCIC